LSSPGRLLGRMEEKNLGTPAAGNKREAGSTAGIGGKPPASKLELNRGQKKTGGGKEESVKGRHEVVSRRKTSLIDGTQQGKEGMERRSPENDPGDDRMTFRPEVRSCVCSDRGNRAEWHQRAFFPAFTKCVPGGGKTTEKQRGGAVPRRVRRESALPRAISTKREKREGP